MEGKTNMAQGSTTSSVESNHPLVKRVLASRPPIAQLIGFEVEHIGEGRAVTVLQAGPQHANPMGTLHGGVLCDMADAAMGMAFASTLAVDESFT
ncbi:MAG: PaaI family thioesterase, partial [Candidatus Acidiferrales bacterium]